MTDRTAAASQRGRAMEGAVLAEVRAHAGCHGLDQDRIIVQPISGAGGGVNSSYRLSDGRRQLHLKLAADAGRSLARCFEAADLLHERYHGPKALAWIDLPRTGAAGILFDAIPGASPELLSLPLAHEIASALGRLEQDAEVRSLIGGAPFPARKAFLDVFARRFTEDLAQIATTPPPFVADRTIDFLRREAERVLAEVRACPAFAVAVDTPIHSDIWEQNVLVEPSGRWHLIDWDDVGLGDPMLDLAMLVDCVDAAPAAKADPALLGVPLAPDRRTRVGTWRRAILLDQVIEPLVDWLEIAEQREGRARDHREALRHYRTARR